MIDQIWSLKLTTAAKKPRHSEQKGKLSRASTETLRLYAHDTSHKSDDSIVSAVFAAIAYLHIPFSSTG